MCCTSFFCYCGEVVGQSFLWWTMGLWLQHSCLGISLFNFLSLSAVRLADSCRDRKSTSSKITLTPIQTSKKGALLLAFLQILRGYATGRIAVVHSEGCIACRNLTSILIYYKMLIWIWETGLLLMSQRKQVHRTKSLQLEELSVLFPVKSSLMGIFLHIPFLYSKCTSYTFRQLCDPCSSSLCAKLCCAPQVYCNA